jgi:hypothetical protein
MIVPILSLSGFYALKNDILPKKEKNSQGAITPKRSRPPFGRTPHSLTNVCFRPWPG